MGEKLYTWFALGFVAVTIVILLILAVSICIQWPLMIILEPLGILVVMGLGYLIDRFLI